MFMNQSAVIDMRKSINIELTKDYWVIMKEEGKAPYFIIYINDERYFVTKNAKDS